MITASVMKELSVQFDKRHCREMKRFQSYFIVYLKMWINRKIERQILYYLQEFHSVVYFITTECAFPDNFSRKNISCVLHINEDSLLSRVWQLNLKMIRLKSNLVITIWWVIDFVWGFYRFNVDCYCCFCCFIRFFLFLFKLFTDKSIVCTCLFIQVLIKH